MASKPARVSIRIAPRLLRWFDRHGRKNLPWQHPRTPYRVWLSEVMLQQTQVATVTPYFLRFVDKYPTLQSLAEAPLDDVFALWSGLGYYSRARNLHRSAQICMERFGGDLPRDFDALAALPGIGRSTAGAILAQAHGLRFAILDGNVRRVLARWRGVYGWPGSPPVTAQLWKIAEIQTPRSRVADYTQAIMDLGASVCARSRPRCDECPLSGDCVARSAGLTDRLPGRKPARTVPTRKTIMLVLRDRHDRVLLERRPPTGVWAGLWSLPESADRNSADVRIASYRHRSSTPAEFVDLPRFVHTFSHFRLEVEPLQVNIAPRARLADNPDQRWLYPHEAAQLGLPAPVRKLLRSLVPEETDR